MLLFDEGWPGAASSGLMGTVDRSSWKNRLVHSHLLYTELLYTELPCILSNSSVSGSANPVTCTQLLPQKSS